LKIAYISKADRTGGGASLVAEELTALFNKNDHLAHHYFAIGGHDGGNKLPLYGSRALPALLLRRIHTLTRYMGLPEIIPVELAFLLFRKRILEYDLVHFHDLCGAISPLTVAIISHLRPTVWTFHDCSPFTGGCLYPLECQRFKSRCANCPQLGNWPINTPIDLTGTMQAIKRMVARRPNLSIVTPSRWMAKMIDQSTLKCQCPVVIPNGIDTQAYTPLDKTDTRAKLGLPSDRFVVLIIATFLEDERKGIKYALEALLKIKASNPFLILMGNINDQVEGLFKGFDCKVTGFVKEDSKKAAYFSAADVFLFSSLADNMPLVILETMATATPTVGFRTGGVPEMIQHERSGFMVAQRDVDGLVCGMKHAMDKPVATAWGANARKEVKKQFSYDRLFKNHLNLYKKTIYRHPRGKKQE